ncbi:hypothetical protein WJX74_008612 [Apatococcus lobatus]|uniref:HYDIN/VesB/CFA65-like Ig-like domain-containing protein n=1 Tax=Apatococcus lobatus TaxID=904363 RepID=A0AAW1RHI1_9CHLO
MPPQRRPGKSSCSFDLFLRVPRRVDIEKPGTACLNVLRQKDSSLGRRGSDSSKVAPGMDATFIVHFQPASADDYKWDLVVRTERERFLVPVSGTGRRALLEMPSALDFPKTPVKQDSSRSFMITNTGTREARFVLACQAPFTASPTEALLAVGASMRCKMAFKPQTTGICRGVADVRHDTGEVLHCCLMGTGFEVDVEMTPGPIRVPSSFIRNQSQGSFKIINCSKVPLKFEWRNHGSEEDDRHSAAGPDGGSAGPDGLTEGSTPASESDFSQDAGDSEYEEHVLLSRKAVDLHERHAAERRMVAHRQFFHNAAFSLQPLQGCVWPESEAEMTVIFHPSQAENLSATAWCVIEGRQERIPVQLEGRGLGPDAGFAREALDVGEAYIHTAHNYEMQILNKGSIEATFGLLPNTTPFGSKFTFEPTGGSLPVGQSMTITARLMAGTLGPFNESFNFFIEGSSKLIRLQIKGKVVAPSFQVDLTTIDWGPVTSGFTFTKTLTLTNTSKVNMAYAWSVPEDSIDPTKAIFKISPSSGKLSHGKHTDIVIEYQCAAPFEFQYHLMMGIPNVNRSAVHMAMRAEYVVPIVRIPERIDFGRCSIRSPYTQALVLVNQGKMPAKYQITSLAAHELATLTAEAMSGEIPARGEANVAITLCALHLGRMTLTAHVQVVGMANDHPKKILIGALSIGATLMAQTPSGQPKLAGTDIAFGSVPVLKETIQKLRIVNPGPIPASFSMSMETRDSPFKVQPLTAELIPNEELELEIMVNPDQTKLLRDTLHVIINEGDDLMFPTTAVGAGQLITCDASTAGVDFGHQFIGWQSSREVLVRNHSRKSVTLIWDNATIKEQVVRSKRSGTNQARDEPAQAAASFSIEPLQQELPAKTACNFLIRGNFANARALEERLRCIDSELHEVFSFPVRAHVAIPALECNPKELRFLYNHSLPTPATELTQTITLINISHLPINTVAMTDGPFLLDHSTINIPGGQSIELPVTFNPNYRGDLKSCTIEDLLKIRFADNGKLQVTLIAEVIFPNIELSNSTLPFGHVLSTAVAHRYVVMKNSSKATVNYKWYIQPSDSNPDPDVGGAPASTPSGPEAFDISPGQGILQPKQAVDLDFCFYAPEYSDAQAVAVCDVENGPTYRIPIFKVQDATMDFGPVPYDDVSQLNIVLRSTGLVPFSFFAELDAPGDPAYCSLFPRQGDLTHGTSAIMSLKIRPGAPRKLEGAVIILVEGKEPLKVPFFILGLCMPVLLTLPRAHEVLWDTCRAAAKAEAQAAAEAAALAGTADQADANADSPLRPRSPQALAMGSRAASLRSDSLGSHRGSTSLQQGLSRLLVRSTSNAGQVNIEEMTLDADADQRRLTKLIVDGVAGHLGHRESNARGLRHTSSISGASGHRQSVAGTRSHRPSAMGEQDRYRQSNAEDMGHGSQSRRPSVSGSADSMRHRPSVGGDQRHRPSMMDDGHGEPASHRPSMGGDQRHHRPSHAGGIDHQDNGPLSHRQSTYGESAAHGLVEHRESMAHGLEHRESMAGTLSHRPSAMGDMSHRQSTLGDMSHRSSVARGGHRGRGPQGQDAAHHNTHPPATVHPWETTIHLQSGRVHQAFAAYILDFGNIARQQSKTLSFRLLTISGQEEIAFTLDKAKLEKHGLSMSIGHHKSFEGSHSQPVHVHVTLQTRRLHLGPMDCQLPVHVRFGPIILVDVKANIIMPEVEVIPNHLHFGDVRRGCCKVMAIQLHNTCLVPAEWHLAEHFTQHATKSGELFACSAMTGTLQPNQRELIKVVFTPGHTDGHHNHKMLLNVTDGSAHPEISCTAHSHTPHVDVEPHLLDLGASLPLAEGGAELQGTLTLHNPHNHAIEVYCLDMDTQYLEEEQALYDYPGFLDTDVLMLPPRGAGEPMWQEIMPRPATPLLTEPPPAEGPDKAGKGPGGTKLAAPIDKKAAPAAAGKDGKGSPQKGMSAPVVEPAEEAVTPGAMQEWLAQLASQPGAFWAIIFGTPTVGKTTQAQLMAKRYGVTACSLDQLLQEGMIIMEGSREPGFEVLHKMSEWLSYMLSSEEDAASVKEADKQEAAAKGLEIALKQQQYAPGLVLDGLHTATGLKPADVAELWLTSVGLRRATTSGKACWQGTAVAWIVDMTMDAHTAAARLGEIFAHKHGTTRALTHTDSHRPASSHTPGHAAEHHSRPETASSHGGLHGSQAGDHHGAGHHGHSAHGSRSHSSHGTHHPSHHHVSPEEAAALNELERKMALHATDKAAVEAVIGPIFNNHAVFREVQVGLHETPERALFQLCGLTFKEGVASSVMPAAPMDAMLIPDPYVLQVVHRPHLRHPQEQNAAFSVMTLVPSQEAEGAKQKVLQSRWIIQPKRTTELEVVLQASALDIYHRNLDFEVMYGRHSLVKLEGERAHPHISQDPKVLFPKQHVGHYDPASNTLDYGPILVRPAGEMPGPHGQYHLHLLNDGRFPATVKLGLASQGGVQASTPPLTPTAAKTAANASKSAAAAGSKPGQAAGKGQAPATPPTPTFQLSTQELTIQPGENATITMTALPTSVGVAEDTVICQVVSSPVRVDFKVTCMGAKPQIDLQVADCPDPVLSQQQASTAKGGAHGGADRSRSPAKGSKTRKPSGDENATEMNADAKKVPAPVRKPSSTSLRARPGANQAQAPSTPTRPTTSASLGTSARRPGPQSRTGGKPARQLALASPPASKPQPDADVPAATEPPQAAAASAAAAVSSGKPAAKPAEAAKPAAAAGKGKKGASAAPEPTLISLEADQGPVESTSQVTAEGLRFKRQLTGARSCKAVTITNKGLIPAAWKLGGMLPACVTLSTTEDVIMPGKTAQIVVTLGSKEPELVTCELALEVSAGGETTAAVEETINFKLHAEIYRVMAEVQHCEGSELNVDWGHLKGVDQAVKQIFLLNKGRFPFRWQTGWKKQGIHQHFKLPATEGTLAAGSQQAIDIIFNEEHALEADLLINGNNDLGVTILDPLYPDHIKHLPVKMSLKASFNRCELGPACLIDFGPNVFGSTAAPRTAEITNSGSFPLSFALRLPSSPATSFQVQATSPVKAGAPAAAAAGKAKPAAPEQLAAGSFSVSPALGNLAPGEKQLLAVTFSPVAAQTFEEQLVLDVSDRSKVEGQKNPLGLRLIGEACNPRIDVANLQAIFATEPTLTLVHHKTPSSRHQTSKAGGTSQPGATLDVEGRAYSFGLVLARVQRAMPSGVIRPASNVANAPGSVARLSIKNPGKVPSSVVFNLAPITGAAAGAQFPMTLDPASVTIPSASTAMLAVPFMPTAMGKFAAMLEATVQQPTKPSMPGAKPEAAPAAPKLQICRLSGEGGLPSLSIELPKEFEEAGQVHTLRFSKLLKGKTQMLQVRLMNMGRLPTNFSVKLEPHAAFKLAMPGIVADSEPVLQTLQPSQNMVVNLTFAPPQAASYAHEMRLEVMDNPFEQHKVALLGESSTNDLVFDGLPEGAADEMRLPDTPLSTPCSLTFSIQSLTSKHFRWEWQPLPNFTCAPLQGHLPAGASQAILLTFQSDKPLQLKGQPLTLRIAQINGTGEGGSLRQWASQPQPAEPAVQLIAGSTQDLQIKVHAVADSARPICDLAPINFERTPMLQQSSFAFPLSSSSLAKLHYKWVIQDANGATDASGLYQVSPAGGSLAVGQVEQIVVRFCPTETSADLDRSLVAVISNLAPGAKAPVRALTGAVLRPLYHFELPESTQPAASEPDLSIDGGPDHMLELAAPGSKLAVQASFHVLNPTDDAWEWEWQRVGPLTGTAGAVKDSLGGAFLCKEEIWKFIVAKHKVEVLFLLRGMVRTSRVNLLPARISFGKVAVGKRSEQVIHISNDEDISMRYIFDNALMQGPKPLVIFNPPQGTLKPRSQTAVKVSFTPPGEGVVEASATCIIKQQRNPLIIYIHGEGLTTQSQLAIEQQDGNMLLLSSQTTKTLDFGQVLIDQKESRFVRITNQGSAAFSYEWNLGKEMRLSVKPAAGEMAAGQQTLCCLTFAPRSEKHRLHSLPVSCRVGSSKHYNLLLTGQTLPLRPSFSCQTIGY